MEKEMPFFYFVSGEKEFLHPPVWQDFEASHFYGRYALRRINCMLDGNKILYDFYFLIAFLPAQNIEKYPGSCASKSELSRWRIPKNL